MKKKEYDMVLDEKEVKLSLSRKSIHLDNRKLDVKTVSIGKRRDKTTFQIILYIIAVIAAGVIVYASLSALIKGDDESSPFVDLEYKTVVPFKENDMETGLYISARDGNGIVHNLGGSGVTFVENGDDTISVDENIHGPAQLRISFYGSAVDIRARDISHLRIMFDTQENYTLRDVKFIVTGLKDEILDSIPVDIPDKYRLEMSSGRTVFDIEVDKKELVAARVMQEGNSSRNRGIIITLELPDGMDEGEYVTSIQWGPEYYHETTTLGLLIGAFSLVVTAVALLFVYRKISIYDPCLIMDTDEREYILFGDNKDISELYLGVSRITIPKMEGTDERKKERPGITKGKDLIDKDEADQIGKDLKKIPGGSGKMIVHQCPECLGTELYYESGFMTGYKYHCKNCDYVGSFVIEKQVDFDQ